MEHNFEIENDRACLLVYLMTLSELHKCCNEEYDDTYELLIRNEVIVAYLHLYVL
jgi:hypothetical protein